MPRIGHTATVAVSPRETATHVRERRALERPGGPATSGTGCAARHQTRPATRWGDCAGRRGMRQSRSEPPPGQPGQGELVQGLAKSVRRYSGRVRCADLDMASGVTAKRRGCERIQPQDGGLGASWTACHQSFARVVRRASRSSSAWRTGCWPRVHRNTSSNRRKYPPFGLVYVMATTTALRVSSIFAGTPKAASRS